MSVGGTVQNKHTISSGTVERVCSDARDNRRQKFPAKSNSVIYLAGRRVLHTFQQSLEKRETKESVCAGG